MVTIVVVALTYFRVILAAPWLNKTATIVIFRVLNLLPNAASRHPPHMM